MKKEANINRDLFRKNLLIYTRKAFGMIPVMKNPYILDIGCGTGIPTLELAKLSSGRIVGMDIDTQSLAVFNQNLEASGLKDRIEIVNGSLYHINFPEEIFDLVWSEGCIKAIGFLKGINEWKKFIKPRGFLVIHEGLRNIETRIAEVDQSGFDLVGYFKITKKDWWNNYYRPMQELIDNLQKNTPDLLKEFKNLKEIQMETEMVKKNPEAAESWFFIMQRR